MFNQPGSLFFRLTIMENLNMMLYSYHCKVVIETVHRLLRNFMFHSVNSKHRKLSGCGHI